jgi:hypothetical protein
MPMGGTMEDQEILKLAKEAFEKRHPDDTQVTASEPVRDIMGGYLAVVRSIEKNGNPNEELVYIYPDKTVRVFKDTEEMARFFESKARPTVVEVMTNITFIAALVFVFLIVATFASGFVNGYGKEALAALNGVLGTAAGFFFGSKKA